MDPFSFWDNLPVIGSYFAGMPRFMKFILTASLVLILLIILGKRFSGENETKQEDAHNKETKPKESKHAHHRHHHGEQESSETETEATVSGDEDLFGGDLGLGGSETGDSGGLDLGESDGGSIENILSGQPITPETDLLSGVSEKEEKPEKEKKQTTETKKEAKKKQTALPEGEGPIGLPEDLEAELEREDGSVGVSGSRATGSRRKIGKKPPVEFEEINLAGGEPKTKKVTANKEKTTKSKTAVAKPKGGFLAGIFDKPKKKEKIDKHDIMEMLDKGTPYDEIVKKLEDSGMNHGEARRFFADIKKKWETARKPLLDKKLELENQKKMIQYQYLKMQIDEQTFRKMMTDLQKKLVDVQAKLKFNERLFE